MASIAFGLEYCSYNHFQKSYQWCVLTALSWPQLRLRVHSAHLPFGTVAHLRANGQAQSRHRKLLKPHPRPVQHRTYQMHGTHGAMRDKREAPYTDRYIGRPYSVKTGVGRSQRGAASRPHQLSLLPARGGCWMRGRSARGCGIQGARLS